MLVTVLMAKQHSEIRYDCNSVFRASAILDSALSFRAMPKADELIQTWLRDAVDRWGKGQSDLSRQACRRLGRTVDHSIVNKALKGKRNLRADEIAAISALAGVPMPDFGALQLAVRIVGIIEQGAIVKMLSAPGGEVTVPDGSSASTAALEIQDDALGVALKGWVAYFDNLQQPPRPEALDQLCVIKTDGRVLVRKLRAGREPGRYDLWGYGEPINDCVVEWAQPVKALLPRR